MTDRAFQKHRDRMIRQQLVGRDIRDTRVLEAMRKVPRHAFVPRELQEKAYDDGALAIAMEQTISQPYMVALMTQLLDVEGGHTVLEVGTGSGYQSAILAELAGKVVTIERHRELSHRSKVICARLGYDNIEFRVGDGTLGCPEGAPYDRILITAAAPNVPAPLKDQLAVGGRLVCPIGSREEQCLFVIERAATGFRSTESIGCRFVPLLGEAGWEA